MPFLNSSTALPTSRAPEVRRLVPNTSSTITNTISQCQMLKLPMMRLCGGRGLRF
jgi:lipid A disaccharide synthetase